MDYPHQLPLITTIRERCRVCYTCVRECPAKAIRIADGQAAVISERCIGCGNCVRTCSQGAKQVLSNTAEVKELLDSEAEVVAIVAPSFPAEFQNLPYQTVVGMIRQLGFDKVVEVAFGADLVAERYVKLLAANEQNRYISTACPGIIGFIEKYEPNLVGLLAPIVSPMVAIARALKQIYHPDLKIVFIGPCIAKKGEAASSSVQGDIDAVLTFVELRELFRDYRILPTEVEPSDFDPPHGSVGAIFPVSRGLLQAANIHEDLLTQNVVSAEGRTGFVEAIRQFEAGDYNARLLEILCCNGCIMGAGMSGNSPLFRRRSRVADYVRERVTSIDQDQWAKYMEQMADLDLGRGFITDDQRLPVPSEAELAVILGRMGKHSPEDELNCGACGYDSCREHAIAIGKGLAESEMCLPYIIEQLRKTIKELAVSNNQLATTQQALVQSEKLASMGQLAAGIAHEVNNPLGVVLMYSHLLMDEQSKDPEMTEDLRMIVEQADRCKKIVSGLLNFARQNKVILQSTNLETLVERSLKGVTPPDNIEVKVINNSSDPNADMDLDQIAQVLVNLISNAYAAMPDGGSLTVSLDDDEDRVTISVTDTGVGIPKENRSKIFEPFFTTKQIGKGTGLGLAVAYGIVKMHSGDIRLESNDDPSAGPTGTTFKLTLPRRGKQN